MASVSNDQDGVVDSGRLYYCTAAGGFEEVTVPLDRAARESAETLAEVVGHALGERAAGHARSPRSAGRGSAEALSRREQQVLELIAVGNDNKTIGATLCISPNTVAAHVRNILGKTGASNRAEAAVLAIQRGLLDRGEN